MFVITSLETRQGTRPVKSHAGDFRETPEIVHDFVSMSDEAEACAPLALTPVSRKCYKISRHLATLIDPIFFCKNIMLLVWILEIFSLVVSPEDGAT